MVLNAEGSSSKSHLLPVTRKSLPADFLVTGRRWNGRRAVDLAAPGDRERLVIIRGDLDEEPSAFNTITRHLEKEETGHPSSALLKLTTQHCKGDILEFGTSASNTELLHSLVRESKDGQMLVTADSDSDWIQTYPHMIDTFHQFVFVPLYSQRKKCSTQKNRGRSLKTDNQDIKCQIF